MRLALIVHSAATISNFRGPLVRDLIAQGVEVLALAPDFDAQTRAAVVALGAQPIDLSLSRATMNPFRDLRDLVRMFKQLLALKVDATFAFTIKPVIYGTLAARLAGVPFRFAMIEGAGHVFTDYGSFSLRQSLVRVITLGLYAIGLSQATRVFVLNRDDLILFTRWAHAPVDKVVLLDGIGLDLEHYKTALPAIQPLSFILVARLLKEKGVYDYIEAAKIVKTTHPEVRFILVGDIDLNPSSVSYHEVQKWKMDDLVEVAGYVSDVRPLLARASVFVLPSYREGLPRSTQEAMALGRPVITTDVPGCRDTVVDGENGFLVPVRDPAALAAAMLKFVNAPELVAKMGAYGRAIAERRFEVNRIDALILNAMDL